MNFGPQPKSYSAHIDASPYATCFFSFGVIRQLPLLREVDNWVQFLESPPQKFARAKNRPKFGAIFDNFRL